MTIVTRRPPIRARDIDGRDILRVPLANIDLCARVFPEDFDRLLIEGHSPNWCWNNGMVKVRVDGKPERVARLLRKPEGNARVGHADRDPLNLRADNLQAKPFKRHERTGLSA
ncbi:MAG: hypothetical protein INR68_13890 [Methylobacterium mesophilicum]|nr:hypothetical protein [Methylobacterium mesophilicum]